MTNIGLLYYGGHGVARDYEQAMASFRKAANANDATATYCIGLLYERGEGVAKDQSQAISWYRKAAALGDEDSKKRLKALGSR